MTNDDVKIDLENKFNSETMETNESCFYIGNNILT